MRIGIGLLALALTPLFAQQPPPQAAKPRNVRSSKPHVARIRHGLKPDDTRLLKAPPPPPPPVVERPATPQRIRVGGDVIQAHPPSALPDLRPPTPVT